MKINELAKQLNISARAIRYYEEKGLLQPRREQENDYRLFTEEDAWRLQAIICLREIGMKLEDIKQVLKAHERSGSNGIKDYLELQRSAMYAQWLELKQMLEVTDQMIQLVDTAQELPLEALFQLSLSSKQLRVLRNTWRDKWNFDQQAERHDHNVRSQLKYRDYDQALDCVVQLIDTSTHEIGLDIGTGTGNLAQRFTAKGTQMCAVDQSLNMLRVCRTKNLELETKQGNFLALPYADNRFDFAVSSYAFHLLSDAQKALAIQELKRILKPHGRICIADLMLDQKSTPSAEGCVTFGGEEKKGVQLSSVDMIVKLFDEQGYVTKLVQINPSLHVLLAVPYKF